MESIPDSPPSAAGVRLRAVLRAARARVPFDGLWNHGDFMRLWAGQTVSQLGSTITREALPYTAILALHATPLQMGLLGAASAAPLLLIGLFAGVWVDRLRRRPILIATDMGRALLLLSIPVAYLLGWLRIEQLYGVAALVGILSVFFDVAYTAFLPALVERDQLVEGNSKLGMSGALAEIAGPPIGGALVQLISGPVTVLLDALSYVFSASVLLRIRAVEPPPAPAAQRQVWGELVAGLRAVRGDPLLRAIAVSSAISSFFGWFFGAIYGLYALNELGLSPLVLGLTVACGGIGSLLGAALVAPTTRRFGLGRSTIGALLVSAAGSSLIWLAGGLPSIAVLLMMSAQIIGDLGQTLALINKVSLTQTITPDRILGRVNASMRVLSQGIGTLGLLAGGVLATLIGLRPTVAVALLGGMVGTLWLLCSPLRHVQGMPAPTDEAAGR
jgi:MFS family permease